MAAGGTVNDKISWVNVAVSHLSVFAVLGVPGGAPVRVYLPVVMRTNVR